MFILWKKGLVDYSGFTGDWCCLADFLLLDKLELLLVDDILGEFFLGLALFLETNFVAILLIFFY